MTTDIETIIKAMTIYDANNGFMTPEDCAKFLEIHINTMYKLLNDNKIIYEQIGSQKRIPKLQFLKQLI